MPSKPLLVPIGELSEMLKCRKKIARKLEMESNHSLVRKVMVSLQHVLGWDEEDGARK